MSFRTLKKPVSDEQQKRKLVCIDQSFTISEKFYSEMAEKFSFDLRRIKQNSFFSDVTVT
jgi:hypothetical protein